MKVLLLIESLTSGGRERRLIELVKGCKSYPDIELGLIVFSERIHYKEIYDLDIPVTILKRVPKKNPKVFYRLYKYCKEWKPDVVHSWGSMSTILAIPTTQALGIPLINGSIVDAPENLSIFNKDYFRAQLAYPFSKVVIGNSNAGLIAYNVPESKKRCIYNGFDLNRINNLESNENIRLKFQIQTAKVVGMVGSFSPRKDFKTYIKAALNLMATLDDVTFLAIGDGPQLKECKKLVTSNYRKRFIFTGIQKDVESLVSIFDVGVLSTNTKVHGEGISNAILEYMALGKPTVATTGGGTNEAIADGETGFLVAPDSVEDLVQKLTMVLTDDILRTKMGKAAKNRMEKLFMLDRMTEQYITLYRRYV
ncbi:glycosyltransferase [Pseudozobellia sp. WGM2]|uniref:glycosyltransferase n=1 Tax=Pseudozobellia sp. WGM2 TaxID=2787625 RepID=UPI001ADFA12B|nr:glycosyltransferase [Pseudozobellia sp. WGM2]